MPLNRPALRNGFSRGLFHNSSPAVTLTPMQWRRGLAFATIHLAVAIPIVLSVEADDEMWLNQMHHHASTAAKPQLILVAQNNPSTDSAPDFSMCDLTDQYSPREGILVFANLPPMFLTAWRAPCPPRWSISGMLLGTTWEHPTPARIARQRIVDEIFVVLIAIQWLLIGSYPLSLQLSLRRDPAAIVTICTVASAALTLIPDIRSLATIPMMFAFIAWLWWLGFIFRMLFRSAWRRLSARRTV
jgi:hypothetical protein